MPCLNVSRQFCNAYCFYLIESYQINQCTQCVWIFIVLQKFVLNVIARASVKWNREIVKIAQLLADAIVFLLVPCSREWWGDPFVRRDYWEWPHIEIFAQFCFHAQRMLAELILEEIQLQIGTYWISNGNLVFSFVRVPNILDAKIKTNRIYFAIAMKLLRLSRDTAYFCAHTQFVQR